MQASLIDAEMCVKHRVIKLEKQLVAMLTKHVDDVKFTGTAEETKSIIGHLHETFGELKIEWYQFTNCGVRHYQDQVTMEITLDQVEYVQRLRPMAHIQLRSGKPDDMCCPELQALYMSLLGAITCLTHTRIDIVVFICAFQRWTHKPSVHHARKLNKLLTWIQKNPRKLMYRRFGSTKASDAAPHTHLRVISDAAYKSCLLYTSPSPRD